MKRFKAVCAYDGTDFLGWQSQAGGRTIQDILEEKLKKIFKITIRIHGSGRTDSGVHAHGQVFHFDANWKYPTKKLLLALRVKLPQSIQLKSLKEVPKDFHGRFSVKGKRYVYQIYKGYAPPSETRYFWSVGDKKLNIQAMKEAAKILVGKHDFSAFGASLGKDACRENPVKELRKLDVKVCGPRIRIITEGSGYLYKMVRSLTGTLVSVGMRKLSVKDVEEILKSRKRTRLVPSAPPHGLFLEKVFY